MSLKTKAVSGLIWTFSSQFSVQLISFLVQVVLARILLPADFGLIGMVAIFIAIGNILIDGGLTSSLIRTVDAGQKDFSTVFFINLIFSIVVYIILFTSAPFISVFFKQPLLTSIIRVTTLSIIIQAFAAVQSTRLTKAMNFKLQMQIQVPSIIIGGIAGIILAFKGYGVWSLVWMNLIQKILFTIQHWFFGHWYPSFIIDLKTLKHHFKFGYKLTLSGLLESLYENLYNVVIGKYFSVTQLGLFNRAQSIQMLPVSNISSALNTVTFPLFSSIQHDDVKLKSAYKSLMIQVIFWVVPMMVLFIIIAEPLFRFLLGDNWLGAVPYFQIMCLYGILYPLHLYNLNILIVKGRSDLFFKLEVIKKAINVSGVFFIVPFGIYALLYFQLVSSCVAFFINSFYSGKIINYPVREQIADIFMIVVLGISTGVFVWLINTLVFQSVPIIYWVRMGLVSILYFISYLAISYMIKTPAIVDFRQLIFKR